MVYETYERNKAIVEEYMQGGVSYADLAKKYGMTRQRIGYLVKKNVDLFGRIANLVDAYGLDELEAYKIAIQERR